jgi:malonyl-CoA/methylmalonyl-CoA synthetase
MDENGVIEKEEIPGEIQIKGDNVFKEYWGKAEATQKAFTEDGWFKTGDVAVVENGYYRILDRDSVDIIKSGGYKISALEIEEVLRKHPQLNDCAVVGIPDEEWGELVVAAVVVRNKALDLKQLNEWMRGMMPPYKTPRKYLVVDELPRNDMGKVTKNDVKERFKNIGSFHKQGHRCIHVRDCRLIKTHCFVFFEGEGFCILINDNIGGSFSG